MFPVCWAQVERRMDRHSFICYWYKYSHELFSCGQGTDRLHVFSTNIINQWVIAEMPELILHFDIYDLQILFLFYKVLDAMDMKTKKECSTCKAFPKLGKWMCLPSQHFSFLNFLSSCSRLLYSITMWSRENNHLISLWPFSQFSISRELVSAYKHLGPELKRLDLISFFLFFIVF